MPYKSKCKNCGAPFEAKNWEDNCSQCQESLTSLTVATNRENAAIKLLSATQKERQLAIETIKHGFVVMKSRKALISAIYWFLGWCVFGAGFTFYTREYDKLTGCVYRSVAPFLNPGYIITCELFRERFEIGKRSVDEVRSK